jgi:hypothetical protein
VFACALLPGHFLYAQTAERSGGGNPYQLADSVTLMRTRGGFDDKAYYISVARDGNVRVALTRDTTLVRHANVGVQEFVMLTVFTDLTDLLSLPDSIESSAHCGPDGTDQPTAILTLYSPRRSKRVVDYQGCRWAPVALRHLEKYMEDLAGVDSAYRLPMELPPYRRLHSVRPRS